MFFCFFPGVFFFVKKFVLEFFDYFVVSWLLRFFELVEC